MTYLLLTFLLSSFSLCRAAGPGTTSFDFLNIGVGARQIGMGGTGVSLGDDVNGAFYNPAALGRLGQRETSLMYTRWLQSISYAYVGYVQPTPTWGNFGGQLHYLDMGNFSGFDAGGNPTGSFGARDLLLGFGWGTYIGNGFHGGANLQYFNESIENSAGRTVAADLGALYQRPGTDFISRIRLGAAVRHLGPGAKFIRQSESLPTVLDFGASYRDVTESWTLAVEAHKPSADSMFYNLGSEYWLYDAVAARVGLDSFQDVGSNFTLGVGIKFQNMQLDYAIGQFGSALGNTHRIGLIYRFGGASDQLYQQGLRQMRLGHYTEAILEFDKVLQIDPKYPRVVSKMKEAKELIQKQWEKSLDTGTAPQ